MIRNLPHNANNHTNPNNQNKLPLVPKQRVEEMLREIAFVLRMTRQVRDQMDAEQEIAEAATV